MDLYPHEVIELMISGSIVFAVLAIATILYRKRKLKFGFLLTLLIFIAVIAFFIIRPYWIDYQISQKSIVLEEYLHNRYPNADWIITPVNFRENKTLNHYYLLVDFADDPHHTYYYFVNRNGLVEQVGGESEEYFQFDQKYNETN